MIVKVKHTKNGNVKITMSLDQAKYLRNGLIESAYGTDKYSVMQKEVLLHIDDQLDLAGVMF
jgi:hypothetical protein